MFHRSGDRDLFTCEVVVVFLCVLTVNLAAICSRGYAASEDIVVAIVNKHIQITKQQLDFAVKSYEKGQHKDFTTKEEKITLIQNLIRRQLILQQEDTAAYRNDPAIKQSVKNYEDSLVIDKYLREHIARRMDVSEEELKNFYKWNRPDYGSPVKVEARHILLRTRADADSVMEKLRQGEDFVQLAKDYSIDLPLARKGGLMAAFPIKKGEALPEIDRVLFSLNEGEISEIVETEYGFHIIRVDKIIPPEIKSFEEVKEEIEKKLIWQKHNEAYNQMAAQLEQKAEIEIFEDRIE
jgi:parvulin-like peptidyl-prolyl isomerase